MVEGSPPASRLAQPRRLLLGGEAAVLVVTARVLLWKWPTPAVLRLLAGGPGQSRRPLDPSAAVSVVRRAGRLSGAACLAQAVALAAMLQRRGSEPAVVLGCRRQGDQDWSAHAWVELDGARLEPLVQPPHAVLTRLRADKGWQLSGQ